MKKIVSAFFASVLCIVSTACGAPSAVSTDAAVDYSDPAGQWTYSINPLTWTTDTSPADRSLNAGACFTDYSGAVKSEIPQLCGCYIDEERGVLKVTDIDAADYPASVTGLPDGGYHIYDCQFFYRDLQENVAVRLEAYLAASGDELEDAQIANLSLRMCEEL